MDKYRIAMSVTLSTAGVFCDHTAGNQATEEAAKSNKRLIPAATVNPQVYFGSGDDLRAITSRGFHMFRFFPDEQGWPIYSTAFESILKHLRPVGVAVMVDAGGAGEPTQVARLAADYSGSVILSSVSGESLAEAVAVMLGHPNVMLETHELHAPGALRVLADRFGAERIIFGSGAPRRSAASSLSYVLSSELSDAEKQLVLGGNIKRILEAVHSGG